MSSIKRIVSYYKNKLKLKLRGIEVGEIDGHPAIRVNKFLGKSNKETLRENYTDIPSVEEVKGKLTREEVTPESIPHLLATYIAHRHDIRRDIIDDLRKKKENVYVLHDGKSLLFDAEDCTLLRSYALATPAEKGVLKYTWVYFNRERLEEKGYFSGFPR